MVDAKSVLKALEKIKKTEDKLSYINEFLKLKSLEERLEILKAISNEIKDDDFRKEINIFIEELELPENTSKPEITKAELEEPEQEIVEAKKPERLEDTVEREKVREEPRKEYFAPISAFYQNSTIEATPLITNIKRDLEREGIFKEGQIVTDEQRMLIKERIEKYLPNSPPENVTNYLNIITQTGFTPYESKLPSLNIRDILTKDKDKKHYKI